jgi:hypothetical protein
MTFQEAIAYAFMKDLYYSDEVQQLVVDTETVNVGWMATWKRGVAAR